MVGFEPLIDGISLPDPRDRHVLAAAIKGRADVIVTQNLKDFPQEQLDPCQIKAQHQHAVMRQGVRRALIWWTTKANGLESCA